MQLFNYYISFLTLLTLVSAAGSVRNNTPWTLSYTRDPNSSSAPHYCRFWNWWTPSSPLPRNALVKCTQVTVKGNGGRSTGDVDGFTFAGRDYWENGHKRTKGVWTKITDINHVVCEDYLGKAICVW